MAKPLNTILSENTVKHLIYIQRADPRFTFEEIIARLVEQERRVIMSEHNTIGQAVSRNGDQITS